MIFSASRLKTFQDCQLKGKFQYVDGLPRGPQNASASFGTVMHHCLELFNKTGNVKLAVETFKDLWENPEKLGVTPEVWPKFVTHGNLKDKGINALENYAAVCKWDQRTVLATEYEFLVQIGAHQLKGYVDLIDLRRTGRGVEVLRITDYKTNSRKPNKAELALDLQFTVYDYASRQPEFWENMPNGEKLFEQFEDKPRRNIWFHLADGVEIDAGGRDTKDFERLYQLCVAIDKAHELDLFVPRIGDACLYCPFHDPCGIHVPTPEELREEESAWI